MEGYFSRLVRQTGMTCEPVVDSNRGSPGKSFPESKEYEGAPLLSVIDEARLMGPQHDPCPEESLPGEGSQPTSLICEVGTIDPLNEERLRQRNLTGSRGLIPGQHEPEHGKLGSETDKVIVLGDPGKSRPEPVEPPPYGNPVELLESSITVERDSAAQPNMQPRDESLPSLEQGFKKDPGLKTDTASNLQSSHSREHIWQTTLREVRHWVTAKPPAGKGGEWKREAADSNNGEETPLGKSEFLSDSYPTQVESQQREDPEIHDFHLSIGTIHLTLEGPPNEIQSHKAPEIRREERSPKVKGGSRLSRHYIRM